MRSTFFAQAREEADGTLSEIQRAVVEAVTPGKYYRPKLAALVEMALLLDDQELEQHGGAFKRALAAAYRKRKYP